MAFLKHFHKKESLTDPWSWSKGWWYKDGEFRNKFWHLRCSDGSVELNIAGAINQCQSRKLTFPALWSISITQVVKRKASWQNDHWVFILFVQDWAADDRNLHKPVHQLLVPFLLIQHWINPAGDLKGQWLRSEQSCFVCENLMLLVFSKYLKSKF